MLCQLRVVELLWKFVYLHAPLLTFRRFFVLFSLLLPVCDARRLGEPASPGLVLSP